MALKNKIIDFYLVWSQSQFYLLCAGHLRLKKLLLIYTWDSILIFEFIWQLMGSIPQPWSFTWKLELWRQISFLVLFQKVYMRIRWDNLLPSNLGNNFELDMKFFWPCFFPFGGEGETLFSSNMHIISDINCTCIYMYLLFFTKSYSFFFFLGLQEDDQMLLLFAMSYTGLSCNYLWLLWINQMVNKHIIGYENYLKTFFAVWYEIVKSSVNVPYSRVIIF